MNFKIRTKFSRNWFLLDGGKKRKKNWTLLGVKTLNFKTLKDTVALGLTNAKRIVRWGWQERIRIKRFFLSATNHSIYDKIVVKKYTTLRSTFKNCGRNEVFKQLLKVVQYITRCILMKYQPSKKHSWHSPAVYEIHRRPQGATVRDTCARVDIMQSNL